MPDTFDVDMVSDLNGTGETTVHVNENDVSTTGADTVSPNNQRPAQDEKPAVAKKVDDTPKPDADKPRSVRDTISDALKADAAAATPPNASEGDTRPRDPVTGQFLEKTEAEKSADAAAASQQVDPNASKPVAAPVGIDPQVFASLPAETQATLARTMEDVGRQQARFASLAPIEQLIAPRIEPWAMEGVAPAQALHQLLALSDFAGRDTPGFIKYIAQANNVDLVELVLGMEGEVQVDPATKELNDRLAALETERTQEQQRQAQDRHNSTVDQVIAFADEKDGAGNPLRPHLSELGDAWLPYIDMVRKTNPTRNTAQILQQAYQNACWANDTVRAKMQQTTQAAADAERLRKEAARVTNARDASASVPNGAPTTPPAAPDDANRSLRDTIKAAYRANT